MSGHSKWATIKHKKGALDAKRGKIFTRVIKEIMIAARSGGDPDMNPRLRTAIVAAKAVSMPADNIKRAIMRGTGELEGGQIDEIMFEGYGPGGAAVLVMVATDNRNRTVSEIRHVFSKNGGNMGEQGSVAWMFERKSQILIEGDKATEDQLDERGARSRRGRSAQRWRRTGKCSPRPRVHEAVLEALEKAEIPTASAEIAMVPKNLIRLEGKSASGMLRLNEALEEHDDVQNVYSNFDIDEKETGGAGAVRPRGKPRVRVLGIDCGTERTGWGVIESDGRSHRCSRARRDSHFGPRPSGDRACARSPRRCAAIWREHRPDAAAVEEVFYSQNVKTALKLAHVRGVALLAIAEARVSLGEYSPLEVKTAWWAMAARKSTRWSAWCGR